jgi:hypothetical protein
MKAPWNSTSHPEGAVCENCGREMWMNQACVCRGLAPDPVTVFKQEIAAVCRKHGLCLDGWLRKGGFLPQRWAR